MKAPYRIGTTSSGQIVDEPLFDETAVHPSRNKADFNRC